MYLIQLKTIEKNIKESYIVRKKETNKIIPIGNILHFKVLTNSISEFGLKKTLKRLNSRKSACFIFICIAVRSSEFAN